MNSRFFFFYFEIHREVFYDNFFFLGFEWEIWYVAIFRFRVFSLRIENLINSWTYIFFFTIKVTITIKEKKAVKEDKRTFRQNYFLLYIFSRPFFAWFRTIRKKRAAVHQLNWSCTKKVREKKSDKLSRHVFIYHTISFNFQIQAKILFYLDTYECFLHAFSLDLEEKKRKTGNRKDLKKTFRNFIWGTKKKGKNK